MTPSVASRRLDRCPPIGQTSARLYSADMAKKLGIAQAAARLGVKPSTWRAYMAREQAPAPDGREEISGTPWWWDSTIDAFGKARPGRGARTDLA